MFFGDRAHCCHPLIGVFSLDFAQPFKSLDIFWKNLPIVMPVPHQINVFLISRMIQPRGSNHDRLDLKYIVALMHNPNNGLSITSFITLMQRHGSGIADQMTSVIRNLNYFL